MNPLAKLTFLCSAIQLVTACDNMDYNEYNIYDRDYIAEMPEINDALNQIRLIVGKSVSEAVSAVFS